MADRFDVPTVSEMDGTRFLHFDSPWIQGAMDLKQPTKLVLSYTQQMMAWLLFLDPPPDRVIGQLGLGAGALARFCYQHLPNPQRVVERNQAVIRVCQQFFRLPAHPRLQVVQADAGRWVTQPVNHASLAVLMVDLYDTDAQGPVCSSLSFYDGCFRTLEPPGILVVNLFGRHESFSGNLANLAQVFRGRVLCLPPVEEGNTIVLAFKGPSLRVSRAALFDRANDLRTRYRLPASHWARALSKMQEI